MKKSKQLLFALTLILFSFHPSFGQSPYSLPPLPYAFNALEPYIDAETMQIHHGKHHQAYVTNLNKALQNSETASISLEDLLKQISKYPEAVRNNAGGHYNHSLFWRILTPGGNTQLSERFKRALDQQFGGIDSLKMRMNEAALKRFGSGWVWLSIGKNNQLFISSTPNQDNPYMDVVEEKGLPILGIDVWEHAYYLKYQNKRGDYLSAIWNVINWNEVSSQYEKNVPKGKFDDWPALLAFHKVMSQTFHPSEEGKLEPLKQRSHELAEKAKALQTNPIPPAFNRSEIIETIKQLSKDSKKLDQLVKNGQSDAVLTKALNDLHDVFHRIVGLCKDEDH